MGKTSKKEGTKHHFGNWDKVRDFHGPQAPEKPVPRECDTCPQGLGVWALPAPGRTAASVEIVVEYQECLPWSLNLWDSRINSQEQSSL